MPPVTSLSLQFPKVTLLFAIALSTRGQDRAGQWWYHMYGKKDWELDASAENECQLFINICFAACELIREKLPGLSAATLHNGQRTHFTLLGGSLLDLCICAWLK